MVVTGGAPHFYLVDCVRRDKVAAYGPFTAIVPFLRLPFVPACTAAFCRLQAEPVYGRQFRFVVSDADEILSASEPALEFEFNPALADDSVHRHQFAAVHFKAQALQVSTVRDSEFQDISASFPAEDIPPLEAVFSRPSQMHHGSPSGCVLYRHIFPSVSADCGEGRAIAPLRLIEARFHTLAFHFEHSRRVRRQYKVQGAAHPEILVAVQVAHLEPAFEFQLSGIHVEMRCAVGRVIQGHRPCPGPFFQYVLDKDIALAFMLGYVCLEPQGVLVDGNQFPVGNDVHRLLRDVLDVTAQEQRGTHNAPYPEMSLFFSVAESQAILPERRRLDVVAHCQHIHIIVMSAGGVCRKIEILPDNVFD